MKTQYKYILLFVWMAIIFFLSAEGAHDSRSRSGVVVGILQDAFNINLADDFLSFLTRKAAHIIAYFVLGLLIYSVIKTYKFTAKRTITLSLLLAFFYAILDEIHQLFVPGRSGEIGDILIDTTAAGIGISVYYLCNKFHHNRKKSNNRI